MFKLFLILQIGTASCYFIKEESKGDMLLFNFVLLKLRKYLKACRAEFLVYIFS